MEVDAQRNPQPNLQPNPLPQPMPRPWMGAKPRPRPPFGWTRQAPALRFRAARTSKDKGQRKVVKWTGQIENLARFVCVCVHVFIKHVHKTRS